MIQLGGVIYKNAEVSSGIWIAQEFEFGQGGLKVFATAAQPRRFVFILPRPGVAVAVQGGAQDLKENIFVDHKTNI